MKVKWSFEAMISDVINFSRTILVDVMIIQQISTGKTHLKTAVINAPSVTTGTASSHLSIRRNFISIEFFTIQDALKMRCSIHRTWPKHFSAIIFYPRGNVNGCGFNLRITDCEIEKYSTNVTLEYIPISDYNFDTCIIIAASEIAYFDINVKVWPRE